VLCGCFSDPVYVVFACFDVLAPLLIGAAPVVIHEISWIFTCFWKNSKNTKNKDEQCVGDKRPHFCPRRDFVCLEFRYAFVGDLLPVFRSKN
jgi:hypothetical protein